MYRFIVGVDVSKEWIDASWTDGSNTSYVGRYGNSNDGFRKLLGHLKKASKIDITEWFICFENTGTYSKPLLYWLVSHEIQCREENGFIIKREAGLRRGKSDKTDSKIICDYAFRNRDRLKPTQLKPPVIEEMKKMLSRRDLLVRHKTALLVCLKEQEAEFSPAMFATLSQQDKIMLKHYDDNIEFVENHLEELVSKDEELTKNSSLAQSVIGVGPIIAWYMIATTDNFKNFATARQYASYSGVAPFPHDSGKKISKKNHVSQMANKKIKSLLSNGATAAILHDPEIKNYFARKISQGKTEGEVRNAVKNKLISRVFATVHRGTPFVKLFQFALN